MPPFVASGKRKKSGDSKKSVPYKKQKVSYQGNKPSRSGYSRKMKAGELKGMDTALTLTPVLATTNTNGSIFVLNLIQPGTGSWNRVGKKAYMQSVRLRGSVLFSIAQTATTFDKFGVYCRMVVVWDKNPSSGAIPTFDTIFGKTDQSGTESTTQLDPIKYDNSDRFSILRDCVIEANPQVFITGGTTNQEEQQIAFDEYIKLGARETVFSGQTNPMTIADVSSGALYCIFRSSLNTAVSSVTSINGDSFSRLRYTD